MVFVLFFLVGIGNRFLLPTGSLSPKVKTTVQLLVLAGLMRLHSAIGLPSLKKALGSYRKA